MNKLQHYADLYQDIDGLVNLISDMHFQSVQFGQEIVNFSYIPPNLDQFFSEILNQTIEIQPNTGIFRKSNELIHVEPFYQHCVYTAVVAFEDTDFCIHEHCSGKNFFDLAENLDDFITECTDPSQWKTTTTISLKKNEFVFFRPYQWFSLSPNKLVQIFLLNYKDSV